MAAIDAFWVCAGTALLFIGHGVMCYLQKLHPCKHEWDFEAKCTWDGAHYANKYRCIHCCKKKEV